MGYRIADNYRKELKKLAKEQGFDLYQMCADPKDIARLIPKKVIVKR